MIALGGHLTFAGKELQKTSQALGYGPDVTLALGPKRFPLSFGLQVGFDWFGSTTERFTYDGMLLDWDLDRRAVWFHGLVRWMPRRGLVRPHVDLLGGGWFHDVSIEPDGPFDDYDSQVIGGSSTYSYGFGLGVNFVGPGGFLAALSLAHLRGGSIQVPDTTDLVVQDDVLYYGEARARGIHQWMLMFNVGGTTPGD